MSTYSRPPRRPPDYYTPLAGADDLRRRRQGRGAYEGQGTRMVPRLEHVADPEALIAAFDHLATHGGTAPGRDGITYADLGRSEACAALRELSRLILAGDYRPGMSRTVKIPKPGSTRRRTLTLRGILDRVVSASLNRTMASIWEPMFLDGSHGFRPNRGTWDLLAALEAAIVNTGRTVLAQDDVKDAFPSVVIEDLMEDHREHITDERLLDLIEAVVRGGDEAGRAVGTTQGDPYSPTCLNIRLHVTHDVPLDRDVDHPPWFRYADNLVYLAMSVSEGNQFLEHVRQLLSPAGFTLKGKDEPIDLREDVAQLLGYQLSLHGDQLRLRPGDDSWTKLGQDLEQAHKDPDPPEAAHRVILGWIQSLGPAFERQDETAIVDRILHIAASQGFREIQPEELRWRGRDAHRRWQAHRERACRRREGHQGEDRSRGGSAAHHYSAQTI
jgi:retron-type reverse transcriptase